MLRPIKGKTTRLTVLSHIIPCIILYTHNIDIKGVSGQKAKPEISWNRFRWMCVAACTLYKLVMFTEQINETIRLIQDPRQARLADASG